MTAESAVLLTALAVAVVILALALLRQHARLRAAAFMLDLQTRRAAALLELPRQGSILGEREFMQYAIDQIEQMTGSQVGFMHFINADEDRIEQVAWSHNTVEKYCSGALDEHYPLSRAGLWAEAARRKQPLIINDYAALKNKGGLPAGHSVLHRLLGVPVLEGGRVRMVSGLGNKSTPYDEVDVETVQLISNETWRIVDQRRAEQELANNLNAQRNLNKRLEEAHNQLLQSEKMASIGQLAAGIAHELNNPIGFVHSNLGTLESYLHDVMEIIDAVPEIEAVEKLKAEHDFPFIRQDIVQLMLESKDGLARVRKIVQDLKSFSHVSEQEWQWADLHQGLDSTLNIVWNELKYKCQVVKEYGDLPKVRCLISQLNQVFMNLLVNAGHAIESKGVITLRTTRRGDDAVCIEIADTGKGIAPEHLVRIFEPFFTTKPVGKGTGLGLSLSYGIVAKHQGRIEVESTPGLGTTFRVILPICPETGESTGHYTETSP